MRIGIDIDNVISTFNDDLLKAFLSKNKELGYSDNINKNAEYITNGMFNWKDGEVEAFYNDNIENIVYKLGIIEGAREYISKLKEDGHFIYIITGRDNHEHSNPYTNTKKWLDENNIYYDKLILTNAYQNEMNGKGDKCLEYKIDIMIDDSRHICEDCLNKGIETLIMDTPYNKDFTKGIRVHNWAEIYEFINNYQKKKYNIILDTDTYNECDDQFALVYMLKNLDLFNIEGITVAPFKRALDESIVDNNEQSYQEIVKICKYLKLDYQNKVFKGSNGFISGGYYELNDAVKRIIDIASTNDKTYILAIGALTNIALAIKKEPSIINKIEIIWLGGNSLLQDNNLEFNFKQDIEAVRIVYSSKVKLTVIPCKNVASNLRTSIYELKYYLNQKSELHQYLINRFKNDGYHGEKVRRVLWDISVIAYMLNKDWFQIKSISSPLINDDTSYEYTVNKHKINIAIDLDANKIFNDFYKKLGAKEVKDEIDKGRS